MQQKELASLLNISPAMVSRLAKRGMPTDSLERAERWRRRHLEPGRVKGTRLGTFKATPRKPTSQQVPAVDPATVDSTAPAAPWLESVGNLDQSFDAMPGSYEDARRRREVAEASIAEMKEGELAGQLIRMDAVRGALGLAITRTRDALLQIPDRLAPTIAAESELSAIVELLDAAIKRALETLTGWNVDQAAT